MCLIYVGPLPRCYTAGLLFMVLGLPSAHAGSYDLHRILETQGKCEHFTLPHACTLCTIMCFYVRTCYSGSNFRVKDTLGTAILSLVASLEIQNIPLFFKALTFQGFPRGNRFVDFIYEVGDPSHHNTVDPLAPTIIQWTP